MITRKVKESWETEKLSVLFKMHHRLGFNSHCISVSLPYVFSLRLSPSLWRHRNKRAERRHRNVFSEKQDIVSSEPSSEVMCISDDSDRTGLAVIHILTLCGGFCWFVVCICTVQIILRLQT